MVTNRRGVTAKKETEKWLHGRGLHNPTVIICKDKGTLCKGLGADIIIDDSPDNLLDVYGASIKTKCVMFKRPWNVGYWGHFPGTVSTVREALSDIK
jgi:hypothetical protein